MQTWVRRLRCGPRQSLSLPTGNSLSLLKGIASVQGQALASGEELLSSCCQSGPNLVMQEYVRSVRSRWPLADALRYNLLRFTPKGFDPPGDASFQPLV